MSHESELAEVLARLDVGGSSSTTASGPLLPPSRQRAGGIQP